MYNTYGSYTKNLVGVMPYYELGYMYSPGQPSRLLAAVLVRAGWQLLYAERQRGGLPLFADVLFRKDSPYLGHASARLPTRAAWRINAVYPQHTIHSFLFIMSSISARQHW